MSNQLDCIVVGAGVIGLAVGRSLARTGREVVVLEAEPEIGMHTSSRNSEVIHAGLYYPEGSLKARLCVSGKAMLYEYCNVRNIPYDRLGKLVVASGDEEVARLEQIRAQASRNDVNDLDFLTAEQVITIEPDIVCDAALLSPSTGIVDSHALMLSLQGEIEERGGVVLTRHRVERAIANDLGFDLELEGSNDRFSCRTLINSAGLFAADVAHRIAGLAQCHIPQIRFAIGHYFSLPGKSPFSHLVYPVPVNGGLGIHATNDLGGSARFGPDVEWVDTIDYRFRAFRRAHFAKAIRHYFPKLDESRLAPAYTGIRPKLSGPGAPAKDFMVQGEEVHGIPGLVNLFGIESPGLTACLAIGDYVAELAIGHQ